MKKGAETSCTGYDVSGKFLSLKPTVDFAAGDLGRRFSGGGGADEVGLANGLSYVSPAGLEMSKYPFTNDQLKEVERQAMIYNKYIVSSLPVPAHLLFPVSTYFPSLLWHSRNNGDPEPGRCKRTDGKKWRCSKEVAIQQKYCERHLHRGRTRSRKPVEADNVGKSRKKARPEQSKSDVSNANEPLLLFGAKKTGSSVCTPYHKGNDGLVTTTEQPWHHLIESNTRLMTNEGYSSYTSNAAIFNQDYADQHPLSNIFSYPTFPTPEMELPIGFIDAWSLDNNPNCKEDRNLESSILINENNTDPSPSLDLSMAMAYCDHDYNKSNPFSYEPFARGGPLGEALHGSGPSSPSAVLHRNMFSHSDGSVCNSPTFRVPPSEVSIKWFN